MWSYFKYREVPYNLRRGPVLFIPPARSTIYGANSMHFRGSLISNRLPNLVKSSRSIPEFKMLSRKLEMLTVGVWYVEGSTLWGNFHIIPFLLYILWDYVITSHLTLYSIQLAGRYIICKNAENVEHHGYWLRVYHFVCHFSLSLNEHFVIFVSWFLLAIG